METKNHPTIEADPEQGTFDLADRALGELKRRMELLNRRAAKLGKPGVQIEILESYFQEVVLNDKTGATKAFKRHVVKIVGETPMIAGFEFIARISHEIGESGARVNVIARAPKTEGTELPETLWNCDPICEHCNTNRRRKDTFILKEVATGSLKRIGRNCLADYLRDADLGIATGILDLCSWAAEFSGILETGTDDDERFGGGGGRFFFQLKEVLAYACRAIQLGGYVSLLNSELWRKPSTRMTVDWAMDPRGWDYLTDKQRAEKRELQPQAANFEEAEKVINHIRSLTPSSDYERNAASIVACEYLNPKHFGLAVSLPTILHRAEKKAETERNRPAGSHFGEVGKRFRNVKAEIRGCYGRETEYGYSTLIIMETENGSTLKWFASGSKEYEKGTKIELTGTVKRHGEYKGRPETILNRCIIKPIEMKEGE